MFVFFFHPPMIGKGYEVLLVILKKQGYEEKTKRETG
jgi:hypothetical protein